MSTANPEAAATPELAGIAQALARTLRHEVGDFLQKVYATVAILNARLPQDGTLEREVLVRLKGGAEACKRLIDAVQDFLSPITLAREQVDLARVAGQLAEAARARYPDLQICAEADSPCFVFGDPRRLAQVGEALLGNACEAGGSQVAFRTRANPAANEVEWAVTDNGPGVPPDVEPRLFTPFFSTRAAHAGLGLALARKLVGLHGGRVRAGNLPEGGFRSVMVIPVDDDGESRREPRPDGFAGRPGK